MRVSVSEWLIYGKYINVDVKNEIITIKNLKFKFNIDSYKNLFNLINLLNVIDKKGYNLNVNLYSKNDILNIEIDTIIEKYIFKDVSIINLSID
jgi:hypothetical protein